MKITNMDKDKLAAKSGVSKRMIGYIFSKERKPTVELAEALASAFDLSGWQIIMPGLQADLMKSGKIDKLIHFYTASSDAGRDYIDRVAEHEAKYKIQNNDK